MALEVALEVLELEFAAVEVLGLGFAAARLGLEGLDRLDEEIFEEGTAVESNDLPSKPLTAEVKAAGSFIAG